MADGPFGLPRPFAEPEGWRNPNSKEEQLLIEWYQNTFNTDREEAVSFIKSFIQRNRIVVKDEYISDGPGYVGPMIVMLGGGPTLYQVFGIDNGELKEFKQEQ